MAATGGMVGDPLHGSDPAGNVAPGATAPAPPAPPAAAPPGSPASPAPPSVTLVINGQPYEVSPEVARNYHAEVARREEIARAAGAPPPPPEESIDEELPPVDYNLIYTNPEQLRAAVDARAEAIADRRARATEEALVEQREAEALEQRRQSIWDASVQRFYQDNPDLNTDELRPIVRTVWRENQTELGALQITPGLQRLAQLTRGYMEQLGLKPGASTRPPTLATSRGSTSASPRSSSEDKEPATLGAWIRKEAEARRKRFARDDA